MKNRLENISIEKKKQQRYYRSLKYPNIPLSVNDLYVVTTAGDRLDLLANQFYNDIRLWWVIATANRDIVRRDSYGLKPGLEIRIPANIQRILQDFQNLNNKSY
jgi:nucleoid-associated protein YgaU